MRSAVRWLVILGLSACAGAAAVGAEQPPAQSGGSDRVEEMMGRYNLHPAFQKLGRGIANIFGGPMEIPLNIHKRYAASDTGGSMATGAVYGLFKGLVRTGVGVYEVATFFLPYPENFAPILPTLEYYRHGIKRERLPLE